MVVNFRGQRGKRNMTATELKQELRKLLLKEDINQNSVKAVISEWMTFEFATENEFD